MVGWVPFDRASIPNNRRNPQPGRSCGQRRRLLAGPDDLLATRPDPDQDDRHADELRDVAQVVSRREELHPWLALPFGAGVALTVDESALLLKLDDVYWTEEGIVSVQLGFAALAAMSAVALAVRVLRRGEAAVLDGDEG